MFSSKNKWILESNDSKGVGKATMKGKEGLGGFGEGHEKIGEEEMCGGRTLMEEEESKRMRG